MRHGSPPTKTMLAIYAIVGLIIIGYSFWLYKNSQELSANDVRAPGVVIENIMQSSSSSSSRGSTNHAKVEFTLPDGTKQQFISKVGTNPPMYSIGQQVEVIYPKDSPKDVEINDSTMWALPLGFGAMGLILFLVGALSLRGALRREKFESAIIRGTTSTSEPTPPPPPIIK